MALVGAKALLPSCLPRAARATVDSTLEAAPPTRPRWSAVVQGFIDVLFLRRELHADSVDGSERVHWKAPAARAAGRGPRGRVRGAQAPAQQPPEPGLPACRFHEI